ncbi:MAG: ATP-binding cassette domain-containing protein [Gammaproteobacteria bacterium]|nr:ATP-binding cassette domain-containing protein [Gammaproteobacteria bacterium]MDE0252217.1 ATP-binding cassette domain-containing protein [Gammaproteobacteria bacterium]MDE0402674.1 ATP-binding cassette domain-containing protein [Gammaproteobacteria bacterium]
MTKLILENVDVGYSKEISCFQGASVNFLPGTFNVVTGNAGAGKSTLIRLFLGVVKPKKGQVKVNDVDLASLNSARLERHRRNTGVVSQNPILIEDRTTIVNVALPCQILGLPNAEIQHRVEETMGLVGLDGVKSVPCAKLSQSEKHRASIARALILKPKLLLADEPLAGLDADSAINVIHLFQRMSKEGSTVIVTMVNDPQIGESTNLFSIEDRKINPVGNKKSIIAETDDE